MIDKQKLRQAAEKAGKDKWQAKKINGDFFVIRHGSYTRHYGYTTYQPIAEIENKPVRDFVALTNPATVLALLDELEADKEQIKTLESRNRRLEGIINAAERRIAELEARVVNLPKRSIGEVMHMSGFSREYAEGWCAGNDNARHEIRAAGVKIKGE